MPRTNNRIPEPIYRRRRQPSQPEQPPALDLSKVIAAAQARASARQPGIDMARVQAAVATRSTPVPVAARAVHMALAPEDSTRRRPMSRIGSSCSGFNHGAFLNDSQS